MRQALARRLAPLVTFALVLGAWQLASVRGGYSSQLFPPPAEVGRGVLELAAGGELWRSLGVSLARFAAGYLGAAVLAVPLGLLLGWYGLLWKAVEPLVHVLRPISPIAWFPLISLWFGIGNLPAVVIIFIAAFYPILLSTVAAVRGVDPVYLKVARNFGVRQPAILWKVVLPASFPTVAVGMHIALGSAWVFLVAGEMLGVRSGLGYLVVDSRNLLRTDLVMVGILFIGVSGLAIDALMTRVESRVRRHWGAR